MVGGLIAEIRADYPKLETERLVHELVRRLIGTMIEDVIAETGRRLTATKPGSAAEVRRAERPAVGFSPELAKSDAAIKGFLYPRMYHHARIERIMKDAEKVVRDLACPVLVVKANTRTAPALTADAETLRKPTEALVSGGTGT